MTEQTMDNGFHNVFYGSCLLHDSFCRKDWCNVCKSWSVNLSAWATASDYVKNTDKQSSLESEMNVILYFITVHHCSSVFLKIALASDVIYNSPSQQCGKYAMYLNQDKNTKPYIESKEKEYFLLSDLKGKYNYCTTSTLPVTGFIMHRKGAGKCMLIKGSNSKSQILHSHEKKVWLGAWSSSTLSNKRHQVRIIIPWDITFNSCLAAFTTDNCVLLQQSAITL